MVVAQTRLKVAGYDLECEWIGTPHKDRPVLVFLHEGLGCIALWRDFPKRLCELTRCAGFVFSRAGYGGSQRCRLPRPLDFMNHEACVVLPQLLAQAEIENAVLVGHSDGGSIALLHASKERTGPVQGVITLAAHVFNEEMCVAEIERARVAYETGNLRDKLAKYHGDNVDTAFYGWIDVWLHAGFRVWNIESCLADIQVPVLGLQGENDPYGSAAQLETIVAGVGGRGERHFIGGCGHNPHLDAPTQTLEICARFVGQQV